MIDDTTCVLFLKVMLNYIKWFLLFIHSFIMRLRFFIMYHVVMLLREKYE